LPSSFYLGPVLLQPKWLEFSLLSWNNFIWLQLQLTEEHLLRQLIIRLTSYMARHVIGLTLLFLSLPSSRISFTSSHLSPLPPHPGSLFPTATIPGISPSPPRLYWPSSTMRTPPPMQHSTSIGPHGLPFGNVRKQGHSGSSSAPLARKDDRTDKSEMELGEAWFISSSTSFQLQSPSFALQNFRYRAVSWDAIWLVA
jgi:hypothetical protein